MGGITKFRPFGMELFYFIFWRIKMSIFDEIAAAKAKALEALEKVENNQDLEEAKVYLLGKKSFLSTLNKAMGNLSKEERPLVGKETGLLRNLINERLDLLQTRISSKIKSEKLKKEEIDVTEPREIPLIGTEHPISLVLKEVLDCFVGLGFEVVEGPEIELDKYNFELLNLPADHPARDAQDTIYINQNQLLRTHTSPMQARTMLSKKPPIRMVCPGRVYRADEVDATHSPVFHQLEALVIDEDVTMGDLRGTLNTFAEKLYGHGITTRFRPSFFPFTEPSAEVDLTCMACQGKGCRVCKDTGWIEVLGSGMVNPKVLEMCGIDSKKYSGFAFGIGLERIAMMKYGIKDMRLLYENDIRFLSQIRK